MNKKDYLSLSGYSTEEWDVLTKETAKLYLDLPGRLSSMYPITNRKAIESPEIGKGAFMISKKWMAKQNVEPVMEIVKDTPATVEEAKEIIDEVIPPNNIPPAPNMPPPPPVEAVAMTDEEVEEVKSTNNFYCEKWVQTNDEGCDIQCEECKESLPKKNITDLPHDSTVETLLYPERSLKLNEAGFLENNEGKFVYKDTRFFMTRSMMENFKSEEEFEKTIVSFAETAEKKRTENPNQKGVDEMKAKQETVEKLKEIVKESGIPKDNVIIATVPKVETKESSEVAVEVKSIKEELETIQKASKEKVETTAKEIAKKIVEPKKEDKKVAKKATSVPKEPIIVATEEMIDQFALMDQIIETANLFKKTHYAISLIKNTLEAKDLTPAKKLLAIENAVNNI